MKSQSIRSRRITKEDNDLEAPLLNSTKGHGAPSGHINTIRALCVSNVLVVSLLFVVLYMQTHPVTVNQIPELADPQTLTEKIPNMEPQVLPQAISTEAPVTSAPKTQPPAAPKPPLKRIPHWPNKWNVKVNNLLPSYFWDMRRYLNGHSTNFMRKVRATLADGAENAACLNSKNITEQVLVGGESDYFGRTHIAWITQCKLEDGKHQVHLAKSAWADSPEDKPVPLGLIDMHTAVHTRIAIIVPFGGDQTKLLKFLQDVVKPLAEVAGEYEKQIVVGCATSELETQVCSQRVDLVQNVKNMSDTSGIPILLVDAGEFNRARTRNAALKAISHDDTLVLTLDMDMAITKDYILRCLGFTVPGKSAYFPVVWSRFNPESIKTSRNGDSKKYGVEDPFYINSDTGMWRPYGYGMMSVVLSDIKAIGMYNEEREGWGREDDDMFGALSKSKLEIFRAYDPHVVHQYHPKKCTSKDVDASRKSSCVATLGTYEGTVFQLERRREIELPGSKSVIDYGE